MEQDDVVRYLLDLLEHMKLSYAVVGSYASSFWGEPRYTHDVDVVVDLPVDRVTEFCDWFPPDEWYISENAVQDAVNRRHQFNVIHTKTSHKIDVMVVRDDEWSRQQLLRRQLILLLPDREGFAAHPEDVILGKLRYFQEGGSDKHLRDICAMLQTNGDAIDCDNIARWAEKLGVMAAWVAVLSRLSDSAGEQLTSDN